MDALELRVDENSSYLRILRILSAFIVGFAISAIAFNFKYSGTIDWTNTLIIVVVSAFFILFISKLTGHYLSFDEKGIHTDGHSFFPGRHDDTDTNWDDIRQIKLEKTFLQVEYIGGKSEIIQLPMYTRQEFNDLEAFLRAMAVEKKLELIS